MNEEPDMLWWLCALISGAIGPAILVYAVRQKDSYSLVFGIVISILSIFIGSGVLMALTLTFVIGLFVAVKKYL